MKDEYVKKLVEEIAKLENKVNSLQDEVYAGRREAADERYKRILLEGFIEEHNKRSWWGRAEKIELKRKTSNEPAYYRFPGIPVEDPGCA